MRSAYDFFGLPPITRVLLVVDGNHLLDSPSLIRSSHLGVLNRWRTERVQLSKHAAAVSSHAGARVAERIVVFSKRDLVPEWGITVDILLRPVSIFVNCL
jgi:hypothetical protein